MTAAAVPHRPPLGGWIIDNAVDAHTTLLRMARMCRKAILSPAIVRTANEIISAEPSRDYASQIDAISVYMHASFRFVDNPVGAQLIRDPASMIDDIQTRGFTQGACDDAAVLVATLGMANGISARFRALAFGIRGTPIAAAQAVPFTHVIADLLNGNTGQWHELDVTRPADLYRLPDVVREMDLEV